MEPERISAILLQVAKHDELGRLLGRHMWGKFTFREVREGNPDMTEEELASAAADGFPVQ